MTWRGLLGGVVVLGVLVAGGSWLWARWDSGAESTSPGVTARSEPDRVGADAARVEPARTESPSDADVRVEVAAATEVLAHASGEHGAFVRIVDHDGAPKAELALLAEVGRVDGRFSHGVQTPVVSDADGLVDLATWIERNAAAVCVVLLPEQPSIRLEPFVLRVDSLGATPAEAVELRCSLRPVASVRGWVVDATGTPLVDYPVRLLGWVDAQEPALQAGLEVPSLDPFRKRRRVGTSLGEWVTTDATGRFESRSALPDARIPFETFERFQGETEHRVGIDGRGVEVRLEVEAGPVVLLDFDPLEGYAPTDYIAALRPNGDQHPNYIEELASPLDPHGGESGGGNAAPVRAGPSRVRIPFRAAQTPLPSYLVLESRDRRHFGFAAVEELARHADEPLRVELATREVLDVRVEWPPPGPDGIELRELSVSFTRFDALDADPSAEPEAGATIMRSMLEAETRRWIPGVSPGSYRMVAGGQTVLHRTAQPLPSEQTIEVPRREPVRIAARLGPPLELHRIEIVVRTASGKSLDGKDDRPMLSGLIAWPRGYSLPLEWSGGTARTALIDVPTGAVNARATFKNGRFATEPDRLIFEAPHGQLELLVLDDVRMERLVLRVLEPQAKGSLWYRLGPGHIVERVPFDADATTSTADGRRVFEHTSDSYPPTVHVAAIELTMEGHEHVWLESADIPPADGEGRRVVEFVPRRGWNMRVKVVHAVDGAKQPQPGIVLAFDDIETVEADDDGVLIHRAESQPERVRVVTPGWELVHRTSTPGGGTVHSDTGRFTLDDDELTVEVRGTER